jgi:hypothetical protein
MYGELAVAFVVILVLFLLSKKVTFLFPCAENTQYLPPFNTLQRDPRAPPFYGAYIPFFGNFLNFGVNPIGTIRWAYEKAPFFFLIFLTPKCVVMLFSHTKCGAE